MVFIRNDVRPVRLMLMDFVEQRAGPPASYKQTSIRVNNTRFEPLAQHRNYHRWLNHS